MNQVVWNAWKTM